MSSIAAVYWSFVYDFVGSAKTALSEGSLSLGFGAAFNRFAHGRPITTPI
jgi:hypothetical protein